MPSRAERGLRPFFRYGSGRRSGAGRGPLPLGAAAGAAPSELPRVETQRRLDEALKENDALRAELAEYRRRFGELK